MRGNSVHLAVPPARLCVCTNASRMAAELDHYPEELVIDLPSGISLEADLWKPQVPTSDQEGNKFAVCLHPWSWLGGRKEDPVLGVLLEPLLFKGYHVLQYNSRGVGKSSGWPSFTGLSEAKDLQDVVAWAMQKIPDVRALTIMGYSHGSLIASMHPVLPSIKTSHLLLSYPLGPRSWLTLFHSSSYTSALEALLKHSDSNVLVMFGDKDEFTSISSYQKWASGLNGNVEVLEVENASHFWRGRSARQLAAAVRDWLV